MPSLVALARLRGRAGFCQTSRTQIMGAIAGEKPAAVLEVALDDIVTDGPARLVGVRLVASRATGGEAVLGGSA
ncbi:hypothetical protein KBI52_06625, partial [Microvirga sp. HBU67558]|uniref:hypothetical protein n=1 Tax=Microvirga sp. HBU67558 TaxID=2824562 RepID=UPI001B37887F